MTIFRKYPTVKVFWVLVQTSKVAQTDGRLKVMQVALGTLGDEETSRENTRCKGEKTL